MPDVAFQDASPPPTRAIVTAICTGPTPLVMSSRNLAKVSGAAKSWPTSALETPPSRATFTRR